MYHAPTAYFITPSQELSKYVTGTDILNVVIRCKAVDSECLKHLVFNPHSFGNMKLILLECHGSG